MMIVIIMGIGNIKIDKSNDWATISKQLVKNLIYSYRLAFYNYAKEVSSWN